VSSIAASSFQCMLAIVQVFIAPPLPVPRPRNNEQEEDGDSPSHEGRCAFSGLKVKFQEVGPAGKMFPDAYLLRLNRPYF